MEDVLNRKQRQWKTTSMEDDLNNTGRRPYRKMTLARLANQALFRAWPSSAPACF